MGHVSLGSHRSLRTLGVALALLVLAVTALARADAAHAEFGLTDFNAIAKNAGGAEETRAGVHPYASTVEFGLNKIEDTVNGLTFPDENVRNVSVDLPAGFVGAPTSLPTCERIDLMANACPAASQVGVITPTFVLAGSPSTVTLGVYNLVPRDGEVADFGFVILGVPVHIRLSVRSGGDYGVRATLTDIPESAPFIRSKLTLWGVPADPVHNVQRGTYYLCFGDQDSPDCNDPSSASGYGGGFPAGIVPSPFLSNPTLCDKPLTTTIAVESWQTPGVWKKAESTTSTPLTGCDRLTFAPSIETQFDATQADAPTGLDFNLAIPHATAVGGTIAPSLRKAVVTLPPGFSMNPSGAEGLTGCTDEQIGIGSVRPIACELSSKIGDATIDTPLLGNQLTGAVYLGQPVAGKPYRLFLTAGNDVYGLSIRVEGIITPDPVTGRVTVTFDNNPQLPFSNLHMRFKGGTRAPLATPSTCGAGTTVSALTPWAAADAAPATPSAGVSVSWDGSGAACPAPSHAPTLKAGAGTPRAGASTTFALAFGRDDRQQYLKDVGVTLPAGLLANIGSVAQCADGPAAAGTCGEGSRIGSTTVASGAGALPLVLGGRVYLTGPYKGAPFGMSIVVPAKAGPFDLGLVVVRAAVFVDPITAAVKVLADPLPQILEGIPLRIRKVNVTIDRERFMINPTSCSSKAVDGVLGSVADQAAALSSRFQVADCSALKLKPSLALSLSGKGQTTDGKHPAISAVLTQPGGQANLKKVRVALPLSLALDTDNANGLCEFADGSKAEPTCPKASIVGIGHRGDADSQ